MAGYYDRDRNPTGTASGALSTSAATMYHPKTYIGNTAEYLVAGWPFVVGHTNVTAGDETKTVNFNYVTQFVVIQAVGGDITCYVQDDSSNTFEVKEDVSLKLEVKLTKLVITVGANDGFTIVAGSRDRPKDQYPSDSWVGAVVS